MPDMVLQIVNHGAHQQQNSDNADDHPWCADGQAQQPADQVPGRGAEQENENGVLDALSPAVSVGRDHG
jgi:hypothetical protein